jgi:hypothetical protein
MYHTDKRHASGRIAQQELDFDTYMTRLPWRLNYNRKLFMSFRITGLSPDDFRHLYGLSDQELARRGVKRYIADKQPGFPDRIEMRDASVGEKLLLLNHVCQPAETPYRASHAIFVREGAEKAYDRVDQVPEVMRTRLLSLRAYDAQGMMLDADVVDGKDIESVIARFFMSPHMAYIHAHNAKRGCYSGRIDRATLL